MFARFRHWFVNVYWYHYRLHTLVGAVVIVAAAFSIYSMVTRTEPDFMLAVASEEPVYAEQGAMLTEFFAGQIELDTEILYSVMYLNDTNDSAYAEWTLYTLALADEQYALFIVGESMTENLADQLSGFLTAEELGLPAPDGAPELIPLTGNPLLEELGMTSMYALVRRPRLERDGTVSALGTMRSEKAAACLKALLGV